MWENSPQKPLLTTRKWFFGHCYVQNAYFLTRISSKYLNSYIFWTGSLRRFRKGRTLNQASQRDLGCLQHHCAHLRWHFIPHTPANTPPGWYEIVLFWKWSSFLSDHRSSLSQSPPPNLYPQSVAFTFGVQPKRGEKGSGGRPPALDQLTNMVPPQKTQPPCPKKKWKQQKYKKPKILNTTMQKLKHKMQGLGSRTLERWAYIYGFCEIKSRWRESVQFQFSDMGVVAWWGETGMISPPPR